MKRLTVCLIAMATMAMTLTSCNKEDQNNIGGSINATFENNEIMNGAKTYLGPDDNQYWIDGDQVELIDASNHSAIYEASVADNGDVTLLFVQNTNPARAFDENNGSLRAYYPVGIGNSRYARVTLPTTQYSTNGECSTFPMFGEGTVEDFEFHNLCGMLRLVLTSTSQAIDSIIITTDKVVTGEFSIDMDNDNMLVARSKGHGTKSVSVQFSEALCGTGMNVDIYLPANTYKVFDMTFFSDGVKTVIRNNSDILISRSYHRNLTLNLDTRTFNVFLPGVAALASDKVYEIDASGDKVCFAQGNLMYIARSRSFWHIADNPWDCISINNQNIKKNDYDRDILAWGANGYLENNLFSSNGNDYYIWPTTKYVSGYSFYTGNQLDVYGKSDWGHNRIDNGGNELNYGWRVLTSAEMNYVINNYNFEHVELTFLDNVVSGYMLTPTSVDVPTTISTKSAWNTLMNDGAVFFPANYYRTDNASTKVTEAYLPTSAGESYYWCSNANTSATDEAYALHVNDADASIMSVSKRLGANVRLVLDVAF